jgi:hypothetical protein
MDTNWKRLALILASSRRIAKIRVRRASKTSAIRDDDDDANAADVAGDRSALPPQEAASRFDGLQNKVLHRPITNINTFKFLSSLQALKTTLRIH